jgi:hypothetical protein
MKPLAKLLVFILPLLLLNTCKKEEKTTAEVIIPNQLLGDNNAEFLEGSFWHSTPISNGFTIARVDTVSLSPTHSFIISRTIPDSVNFAYYYQIYSSQMPVGNNLTLKAHIKGVNLEGEGVSILIRCDDVNNSTVQYAGTQGDISITGTFNWTPYTIDLIDLQSSVKTIVVFLIYIPNTTGTAYFDDITLTQNP